MLLRYLFYRCYRSKTFFQMCTSKHGLCLSYNPCFPKRLSKRKFPLLRCSFQQYRFQPRCFKLLQYGYTVKLLHALSGEYYNQINSLYFNCNFGFRVMAFTSADSLQTNASPFKTRAEWPVKTGSSRVIKISTTPLSSTSRWIHFRLKCSNVWRAGYHRALIANLRDPAEQREAEDDDVMI